MGVAAYQRGNALISRQIQRQFFGTCAEDRPTPRPTPRGDGWGSATRNKALEKARGFVEYMTARGHLVTKDDVAEYLSGGVAVRAVCGKSTAHSVAVEVIDGRVPRL
jgi:hypothetical protein